MGAVPEEAHGTKGLLCPAENPASSNRGIDLTEHSAGGETGSVKLSLGVSHVL